MIKYSNTDEKKHTISYKELYTIISRILRIKYKDMTLSDIRKELADNDVIIPLQILSQIKNRKLPHEYPAVMENLCRHFGVQDIKTEKKTLFTISIEDLQKLQKIK